MRRPGRLGPRRRVPAGCRYSFFDRRATEFAPEWADTWRRVQAFVAERSAAPWEGLVAEAVANVVPGQQQQLVVGALREIESMDRLDVQCADPIEDHHDGVGSSTKADLRRALRRRIVPARLGRHVAPRFAPVSRTP